MRTSNQMVKAWLLDHGYDDIWFKRHTKRHDFVYTQIGSYACLDLWHLFDGMCFDIEGNICLLQMKTNAWTEEQPILNFVKRRKNLRALIFNVTNKLKECNKKYKVFVRCYE